MRTNKGIEQQSELELDSTYLTAFDMARSALKRGLSSASKLNIIQYHTLIKVFASGTKGITQTDLGLTLDLKANVITNSVNALEMAGYVRRLRSDDGDGRVRVVKVTQQGVEHASAVNAGIIEQLYTIFPTQNNLFRSILEASIAASASIDPPMSETATNLFYASRALVSIELIRRTIEAILKRLADVSFHEYRILQRLVELAAPTRIGDLAKQLRISPSAVVRAADQLVERNWATRMASPHDRKAVFVACTPTGLRKQRIIAETINSLGRNYLWKNLNQDQRHAIAQVGHVVIARLQENEAAEREAALELLQPIA